MQRHGTSKALLVAGVCLTGTANGAGSIVVANDGIDDISVLSVGVNAVAAAATDWLTIFDEQFTDNPIQRFKMLPVPERGFTVSEGSGQYDKAGQSYALKGRLSLVRPVRAGTHVELSMALRFSPSAADDPADQVTDLILVLLDGSMVGLRIQRGETPEQSTVLTFVQEKSGTDTKVLKEFRMPGVPPDGIWLLRYRHGLLTLVQGGNTMEHAYTQQLGIPVAGVSWIQRGGEVVCERMVLNGQPSREIIPADQKILQRAARLNVEAIARYRDNKPDEALVKMEEASALYVKVHGENHHDSANSFTNLASIKESRGDVDEARKLWTKALAIHEETLGATHPHTTLTRFSLGKHHLERGDKAKAKELLTRCRDDWTVVHGPDYELVKAINSMLQRL